MNVEWWEAHCRWPISLKLFDPANLTEKVVRADNANLFDEDDCNLEAEVV